MNMKQPDKHEMVTNHTRKSNNLPKTMKITTMPHIKGTTVIIVHVTAQIQVIAYAVITFAHSHHTQDKANQSPS